MADDLNDRVFAALREDPETTTLDTKLFDEASLILPSYLGPPTNAALWQKRLLLMRHLSADLTDARRTNHEPIVTLLIKLFDGWTWTQVSEFGTSSIPYKDGLAVGDGMTSFNRLMLCLLGKATTKASNAEQAAGMLETMQAVVRLWLTTEDTGVAGQAGELLYDLLKIDGRGDGGQGLVWKRIFGDRDVYYVFFESCSLGLEAAGLSKSRKTIAQARLLEWVPKVARLNWSEVSRSHHRDVEERFQSGGGGLLDFVALKMVDFKEDVLMHRCLIDFCSALLVATREMDTHTMAQHDSFGLQYLIMHGLHARTAAIFLQVQAVDPIDTMFLYGPAANYLSTYASEYPKHYLAGQMPKQVNERLLHTLDLTPGRWVYSDSPKHDLHLLASVPRQSLLPYNQCPVALLPSKTTNADVLNTLATIFHGPEPLALAFPASETRPTQSSEQYADECAAARALYFNYLAANPLFFSNLIKHSDTIALKDLALAAINCITAIITANWSPTPATSSPGEGEASTPLYSLPTSTIPTPASGHLAILSPPALEYVLPYLLSPPKVFSNLVGGGRGDAESAAYQVAAAKFDALRVFEARLRGQVERCPDEGFEDIVGTVGRRLAQGVMGPKGGQVGGSVAAMEM
ncbi:hypothetical protein LTR62_007648 [Meristemomyces frigidus]|uniref:Uncharacterized protein n=1 Tax=Meristemomyces frigidus TaxID=1508187 RepID=A0AAN7TAD1_9PEZI|nr:hypothetical protein LTR62_007648 [Meristemomyces frigidus]